MAQAEKGGWTQGAGKRADEVGMKAIEAHGPYKIHGESDIMRRMDILLAGFVEQHRMKLPGGSAYQPCYEIIS